MPRKRTTPTEIDSPAEALAAVPSPAKKARKARTSATAPARKASPRRKTQLAGGRSGIQPAENVPVSHRGAVQDEIIAEASYSAPSRGEKLLGQGVSEYEQIALLAYSFWEARGGHGGSSEEDWFRAEQEIRRRWEAGREAQ